LRVFAAFCVWMVLASCQPKESAPAGPAFDGERALAYVREFMQWGARVPGTDAHVKAGDWIVTQMRQRADTVYEQRWTHTTAKGVKLPLRNVIARFRPELTERVLYVTHWESRPISDNAANAEQRKLPVPGANDGGSGVGLFVALGDLLEATPPSVGVDLVFVDGEDYGNFPNEDVLIGSKYFAENLPSADYQPLFGVVWDMIGDAQPRFPKEGHSLQRAPEVVDRVWQTAATLGYREVFLPQSQLEVTDDHLPLLDKGLRVIDVIDLDYPYHHTPDDTVDKVSARSLKIVGDVAAALVK
jgi:glutaminyl-peptide cyclotransferase